MNHDCSVESSIEATQPDSEVLRRKKWPVKRIVQFEDELIVAAATVKQKSKHFLPIFSKMIGRTIFKDAVSLHHFDFHQGVLYKRTAGADDTRAHEGTKGAAHLARQGRQGCAWLDRTRHGTARLGLARPGRARQVRLKHPRQHLNSGPERDRVNVILHRLEHHVRIGLKLKLFAVHGAVMLAQMPQGERARFDRERRTRLA